MASQRAGTVGLSTGTQKGDVYSFAVVLHEILYRAGLFRCVDDDEPLPAKSTSIDDEGAGYKYVFDFDSTAVRRPFGCLSKVIKVTRYSQSR